VIVLGIIGAAVGVVVGQSRSSVITAVVALAAMVALIGVGRQTRRALIGICLTAATVGVAVVAIDSFDSTAFYRYGSIAPSNVVATTYSSRQTTWATTVQYLDQIPLGAGLGTVGPAAGKAGGKLTDWNAESQFSFLVVELGVPGLAVFLLFQAALCSTILRGLRRERDPRTVILIAGVAAPLFGYAVNWLVGVNTTSPPNAPYLWLAAGVIAWWLVDRQRLETRDSD
jgi:cell division protein FtsW (lipid II flippase)